MWQMLNSFLSHGGCSADGCQLPASSDRQVEEIDVGIRKRADRNRECVCVSVREKQFVLKGTRGLGLGGDSDIWVTLRGQR